jgi:L-prolyl-PCP dehydrogenase
VNEKIMDFSWTNLQDELYDNILKFAKEMHHRSQKERNFSFDSEKWRLCGEQGLMGICAPERYGGLGFDALTTARIIEAFGRGCEDRGLVFSAAAHLFACVMPIVEYGAEELKEKILPRLCSGEWIGANAITESGAGSDVFALKTRAVRDGDEYILTGTKEYVTNGPVADVIIVYATVNPAFGFLGVTPFLVEKNTPGLSVGKPYGKMGLTSSQNSSIYLENCRIPASQRLGAEGQGGQVFKCSMQWERACLFALYVGMMEQQLEKCLAYARERRQFGKPISKNQAISHRIADMKLRLEGARLLLYRACWLFDQGKNSTLDISLAKVAVSEAAIQSGLDAIQIHGGIGYVTEAGVEGALRDAIPGTIFSGTSEIQRDLIVKELGI